MGDLSSLMASPKNPQADLQPQRNSSSGMNFLLPLITLI